MPAPSSWCDVVLPGAHQSTPGAIIIALKDWVTRGDQPGSYEGLIKRQGAQELHPSDQVRGYTEYCRRFHSAVADHDAAVHGCVLFTRDSWCDAYTAAPHEQLAVDYPLFTTAKEDVERSFPAYFQDRLTTADGRFAQAFEAGRYRQDRGFVAQIGAQILDPKAHVFELLDNQRKAFTLCRATVDEAFRSTSRRKPPKRVVIIEGPPGSGKSVIAGDTRTAAMLVAMERYERVETVTALADNDGILRWILALAVSVRDWLTRFLRLLRMNRSDLQRLSQLRIDEAKALLAGGFPAGAYYMAGYAIECAFKSCIAKGVQQYDFPEKGKVLRSYTHNLADLMQAAELETLFEEAQHLIVAVSDPSHGVLTWLMHQW